MITGLYPIHLKNREHMLIKYNEYKCYNIYHSSVIVADFGFPLVLQSVSHLSKFHYFPKAYLPMNTTVVIYSNTQF